MEQAEELREFDQILRELVNQLTAWDIFVGSLWKIYNEVVGKNGFFDFYFPKAKRMEIVKDKFPHLDRLVAKCCKVEQTTTLRYLGKEPTTSSKKTTMITYKIAEILAIIKGDNAVTGKPSLEQQINLAHLSLAVNCLESLANRSWVSKGREQEYKDNKGNFMSIKYLKEKLKIENDNCRKLRHAKAVRNCFEHKGPIISKEYKREWEKLTKDLDERAKKEYGAAPEPGQYLKFDYPKYEEWTFLVIDIAYKLRKFTFPNAKEV